MVFASEMKIYYDVINMNHVGSGDWSPRPSSELLGKYFKDIKIDCKQYTVSGASCTYTIMITKILEKAQPTRTFTCS